MSGLSLTGWGALLGSAIASVSILLENCAIAQITPDTTLPINSRIDPINSSDSKIIFNINGGTPSGSNLFHSFREFSVPENTVAVFNNASNIQNIISRVTGGSRSEIDGLIRAKGTANLFLINPSGIIFGKNASLNIGGSFVATTANAIAFGDRGIFSAMNPESSPSLLTVNPSALLFNQIKTASIQYNSAAPSDLNPTGLYVLNGKNLLLIGGDINIDGGGLFAFGGRVELGGLIGAGTVGLNGDSSNLSLSFPDSVERSNVFLSNGAVVNVIAGNGGSIAVNARNLKMTTQSSLQAGIDSELSSDNSKAGNIEVNATGAINLDNQSEIKNWVLPKVKGQGGDVNITASTLQVESLAKVSASTFGEGKGGNLTIKTNTLLVRDGAQVSASTFGEGKGENLTIDAQDVQVVGTSLDRQVPSGLFTSAEQNSKGDAGNLTIKTNTLLVRDGAQVSASTFGKGKGGNLTIKTNTLLVRDGAQVSASTFGEGKGENLTIDAQDVQVVGTSLDRQVPSGLFTSAEQNSKGDAGNLIINTNTLLVQDVAKVNVDTLGAGDAGDLTINTNTLLVRDGAQVSAGTFGEGHAGDLTVYAKDVQVIGRSADLQFGSGLFAPTGANSTGDAGNLTINTNTLLVQDTAAITVRSLGTGTAGNMTLNARSIRLNNYALLSADTRSAKVHANSQQATINIKSQDLIISRNSNITTNATGENVIGGNINIDTDFLIAFENSDISANSSNSNGGRVRINAKGIFGTQSPQIRTSETSDITATGASPKLNGIVELNTPGVDPSRGLVQLPTNLVDASRQIDTSCNVGGKQRKSSFVVTGRGLPPQPGEPLRTEAVIVNGVEAPEENRSASVNFTPDSSSRIVEAQGWVINSLGEITLTAYPTSVTPSQNFWLTPATCHAS